MHSAIDLELARPRDISPIARMSRDRIEAGLGWSWTPRRIASALLDRDTNVLVARREGQFAGFGIMWYGRDEARLNLLAVHPTWRRHGIGSELVQWLECCARNAGITTVNLEARSTHTGVHRFYQRLGYRTVACISGYYHGRESALRMAHDLFGHRATPAA